VQYSYLQLQAKCPEFLEDTDDLMEIVLAMGFLLMFSVALPAMVGLAFIANFVEDKMIAHRMMYVNKRPRRLVQVGIGVWSTIIRVLSLVGVITNAAIACFVFEDVDLFDSGAVVSPYVGDSIEHRAQMKGTFLATRLLDFVILQNLVIIIRVIIELFINPVPAPIIRAREINIMALDELSGDYGGQLGFRPKKIQDIGIILENESDSESGGESY